MLERRYKQGADRHQNILFPPSIDEYVSENNVVRAIDAYVDTLDLRALGFNNTDLGSLQGGQPAYPPSSLLKLYLYGYMNKVRSSRMLEREAGRNLEVIWLISGLNPSHTVIANFRKDNLDALKAVNHDFVQLCRELNLFGNKEVGIDGTFVRGDASKGSIHTEKGLQQQLEKLNKQIDEYIEQIETNDKDEQDTITEDIALKEKLEQLKERQSQCQLDLAQLEKTGEKQLSKTDADARILRKKGQILAGYNVQIAVDSEHKLLVLCEVVNDGNDTKQLEPMAMAAMETLEVEKLEVDADAGYFDKAQIHACVEGGAIPYVPVPNKEKQQRESGRFERPMFTYDAESDTYTCPADQILNRQDEQKKNDKINYKYVSDAKICAQCEKREQCLTEKPTHKQLYRWEHEEVIDEHKERMKEKGKNKMRTRAALAEHPFGTMKEAMGFRVFLLRGLTKVRAEMSLLMLSYNFKRVLNIIGIDAFKIHLAQRQMT